MQKAFVNAALAVAMLAASATTQAIPLFARQTGFECSGCHFGGNFLELNSTGRLFKLTGYTLGERQSIPLSGMVQAGYSKLANHNGSSDPGTDFKHDGTNQLQQVSLFTGGKIVDNLGAFVQWTYDGVGHHAHSDNIDVRYARQFSALGGSWIVGATLNNSPTTQDVFNTAPAWSFPYVSPSGAFQGLGPQPLIAGGVAQQVAGLGLYADYNNLFYAEFSGYKTADGAFSVFRKGQRYYALKEGTDNRYVLDGVAPYWRLALHGDGGPHSWMVGTLGMVADVHSDPTNKDSATDRYRDYGVDAQYQWHQDSHHVAVQASYIHEKTTWNDAAVAAGEYANSSDTLNTWRLKGSYFYKQFGGSAGWFSTTGRSDAALYGDNGNPKPDTEGYILELDYLPFDRVKIGLQYTGYTKFSGSRSDYAPAVFPGRNASDNNTIYLFGWVAF